MTAARRKVAILVNTIAPYRIPMYRGIGEEFDTCILPSGPEENRAAWADEERSLAGVSVLRSAGLTRRRQIGKGEVYEERYFHAPFGNLVDLFRLRPDAVITNEMGIRTAIALLYGTIARKPVRVWWGGTVHTERGIGPLRRLARRVISRWATRWISYGASSTEYLRTLGIPADRILEIQNCVDDRLFVSAGGALEDDDSRRRPVLLCVGRMVRLKGIDRLLRAAARLRAEGYEFTLLLVGDGPEKPAFEALARELDLGDVEFARSRPVAEMAAVYRGADFLVFPTLNDVWGLVVNEALWSGTPVLASRFAGCAAELLPPDRIFDPLDPDDFFRVLRSALDGEISGADTTPLKTSAEVTKTLVAAIRRDLAGESG